MLPATGRQHRGGCIKNEQARYDIGWDNQKTTHLVWSCRENGPNATTKKSQLTGNLKEGKNEAVPDEPGKMGYIYSHE